MYPTFIASIVIGGAIAYLPAYISGALIGIVVAGWIYYRSNQ